MKPLILGVGNILLSDEGVGVRVVQELENALKFNRTLTSSMVVLWHGITGCDGKSRASDLLSMPCLLINSQVRLSCYMTSKYQPFLS